MTPTDLTTIILLIIGGFVVLQTMTWVVRRWLKLDSSEREQKLQIQIDHLTREVEQYKQKVMTLEKQLEVFVGQYEETAGRLARVQETNNVVVAENVQLKSEIVNLAGVKRVKAEKILFVVIGSDDAGLSLDLATARAVQSETGLEIREITNPTAGSLKRELDRARNQKNQIYLHMAVRSDKDGYQLGNQIVDAAWLSGILNDVIVLLVAGADSSYIGEFLGVVPYVITMSGNVNHRNAAIFSRAFWTEIGKGIGPTRSLKRALDKSPDIKDQIVSHWAD